MGKKKKANGGLPVDSGPGSVSTYKPSKADIEREKDYRAKDAIDTLKRADDIKKDKDLMRDCKEYAKKQIKALSKVG